MKILSENEKTEIKKYLDEATQLALKSGCERAKCGCVIVKDNEIIGKGFNSPPLGLESQRRCANSKDSYHRKVTDKTCCVHAEQRAIVDALRNNSEKILDSTLYFIRIDKDGREIFAGDPYCTICSKMALDVGIKYFVLSHEKGICVYNAEEYNDLSYGYEE